MKRYCTAVLCLALAACGGEESGQATDDVSIQTDTMGAAGTTQPAVGAAAGATGDSAIAVMRDTTGRELGTLALVSSGSGIEVRGRLTGLAPGERAIHLHTVGRCEPSFEAAGGHWNPDNRQHGRPGEGHQGDMPNLTIGSDSTVNVQVSTGPSATLRGGAPNALLDADGAAVMIHGGADDFQSQPAGNAGPRIACGAVQG